LSTAYEREQADLKEQNISLQKELDIFIANSEKTGNFIELARKYVDFSELTTPMLNEFVDKVLVHEADKSSGERVQKVDIYLSFIGKFDIPVNVEEVSQAETEAEERRLAKKLKQREYFHRRYVEKKEKKRQEEQRQQPRIA